MERKDLIFAVLLLSFTVVLSLPYKDCGSKSTVTNVKITGCTDQQMCPLKKNTNVTFEVDFTTKAAVTKAQNVVHGIIGGIPVPFPLDNPDACKNCGLTCPLKSGESVKYKTDIFVKDIYPKVKLVVKWEVKDPSSNDVFCILVPAEIED